MGETLNIEEPGALLAYLHDTGRIGSEERATVTVLAGGVSNRTVRVDRSNGEAWVLKQALARLRVQEDWYSDPARIQRESLGLRSLAALLPSGCVPAWLFEDRTHHLLAMEAVRTPHVNWKTRLLSGRVEVEHAVSFGRLLGTMHVESNRRLSELPGELADRSFFETLRLEPYYRFSAGRNPAVAPFLLELIEETLSVRWSLVHGDFSPKNVLLHEDRLVLLDHEVIHVGDPTFDLGFALTHFLAKARHLSSQRTLLLACALRFWESYRAMAPALVARAGFEARAVRHTLACLLARVEGRSPLEYLRAAERAAQREQALHDMKHPPETIEALVAGSGL